MGSTLIYIFSFFFAFILNFGKIPKVYKEKKYTRSFVEKSKEHKKYLLASFSFWGNFCLLRVSADGWSLGKKENTLGHIRLDDPQNYRLFSRQYIKHYTFTVLRRPLISAFSLHNWLSVSILCKAFLYCFFHPFTFVLVSFCEHFYLYVVVIFYDWIGECSRQGWKQLILEVTSRLYVKVLVPLMLCFCFDFLLFVPYSCKSRAAMKHFITK